MTNLTKLTESLNLQVLTSNERTNLKGGRQAKSLANLDSPPPPPIKPIGGGGIPPRLDNSTSGAF